ncbi:hypothetical protein [Sphingomonas sp.]|uniref:hypothetical protein n=1 Tax=Sphingomonas sp. TaxID=28214 RepID=UPI0035BC7FD4
MPEPIDITLLTRGEVHNLAGHERGLAARESFGLARLDEDPDPVDVRFPPNFRQVSSSFFQGMFSASVRRLGSVEGFFDHYRFDAPAHVRARLLGYAEQVMSR